MNAMKISTKVSACILFCALGFLGNRLKLPLFFDVDFLFGSFFTMLAIMTIGGAFGVIVGIAAGSCTYILWNHPWAIIIFAAEAAFVGGLYSRRKGNLVVYDMLYWVSLGMPLIYLFYHHFMGMQLQSVFVIMLKQALNGLFNALTASLVLILFQFVRGASGVRIPYSRALFVVMFSLVLMPSTVLMVSSMREHQRKQTEALEARVSAGSEAARKILADWIQEHHRNVQILSTLIGNPNTSTYEDMQQYVEIIKTATPAFRGMGVFNRDSIVVGYSPPEQNGKPTVGVDMSARSHIAVMRRDKAPYITDVLMSKLGEPTPIVVFAAPIILAGEYQGYCSGVVETSLISGLLQNLAGQDLHFTVIDGRNRVIVSTIPGLNTMDAFPRPYTEIGGAAGSTPMLWKPDPKPNTSIMKQWDSSFYFRLGPILDNCSWKVVVEESCAPLIKDVSRYSLSRLGLLGLFTLFAAALSHFLSNGFISSVVRLQALTDALPARLVNAADITWPESKIAELDELSHNFRKMADALLEDITQRNKVEDELRYKNILLATQQEVSIEGVLIVDENQRIVSHNRRFVEIWGIPAELLSSKDDGPVLEFASSKVADREAFGQRVQYLYAHRDEISQEEIVLEDARVLERYSAPMLGADHTYLGRVWFFRDVTERKRAEAAMRERLELQDQIARVAATVPGMICSFQLRPDGSACMPFATRMIEEVYGLQPENVREDFSPAFARVHPDDVERLQRGIIESSQTMAPWRETYRIRHPRKGELWVEGHSLPRREADGSTVWHGFIMDVTDRKRAEEALRKSEEQHRSIIQAAMDGYTLVDLEGHLLEVNEKYCAMSGYSAEELLSMRTYQLEADHTADEIAAHSREMTTRGEARFEARHRRKDGTVYDVEISIQYRPTDGGLLVCFLRDITDRKQAAEEKEKLESQLRHAQKLEAIGTLAGGIAHDFNNILSPIIGYTEMALDGIPESDPSRYDLDQVLTAARRARDLVKQILSISRHGEAQHLRPIDMSIIVKEAVKLLRASLPSTIEIRQNIHKVTIAADATQFHQVVVNLCTNAAHAIEDTGIMDVLLEEVDLSAQDLVDLSTADLRPGKHLKLSVKDTGAGMSAETMQRIFDPYFTTKEVGKGTGLGLAVVHGIVKRHGGEVLVRSELGKGSVFEVLIPVAEVESSYEGAAPQPLPKGSERILLVDDEPAIAGMGARILEQLGYKVTAKTNPEEALDLFRSQPDQFDLIITDYTMPQMVGTKLADKCMKIRAELPVIICTGYSERLSREESDGMAVRAVAMKPLDRRQFAILVRDVLDKAKV